MRNIKLIVVPGDGASMVAVPHGMRYGEFMREYGITDRSIAANLRTVEPTDYDQVIPADIVQIHATLGTKGNR